MKVLEVKWKQVSEMNRIVSCWKSSEARPAYGRKAEAWAAARAQGPCSSLLGWASFPSPGLPWHASRSRFLSASGALGMYPVTPGSVFEETVPALQLEVHVESYSAWVVHLVPQQSEDRLVTV